ncbi:pectinesterase inhibitor-like [Nicotiana tomentosiformis]|uniref:pectinesterase inhibitor-like n=1 Tax=Nicotiana tomentosiformis TaxID=4098 RepID=UPI00388CE11F
MVRLQLTEDMALDRKDRLTALIIDIAFSGIYRKHPLCPQDRGISTTDLIPSVCKKTINQTFCLEILGSNPEAKTAHLFTLEKIAINLTITQVNATNDKIQSLLLKEKDPKLRNLYGNCSSNYEDAFAFLDQANLYLQSKQFWEVIYSARDACQDITFCEQSFKKAALHFPLSKCTIELLY